VAGYDTKVLCLPKLVTHVNTKNTVSAPPREFWNFLGNDADGVIRCRCQNICICTPLVSCSTSGYCSHHLHCLWASVFDCCVWFTASTICSPPLKCSIGHTISMGSVRHSLFQ